MSRFRPARTWIWPAIVAGHVLVVLLSLGARMPLPARGAETELRVVLVPPRKPAIAVVADDSPDAPATPHPVPALPNANSPSRAAVSGESRSEAGAVDWYGEGERVAGELGATLPPPACNRDGRPGASLPPCPKAPREFEWRPEEPRVGLAGGVLPYVRLGKRCVVGLGFFGCGVGPLPESNDALFEDMDHPDRPRSSVPE